MMNRSVTLLGGEGKLPQKPFIDGAFDRANEVLEAVTGAYEQSVNWVVLSKKISPREIDRAEAVLAKLAEANDHFVSMALGLSALLRPATVDDIQNELRLLIGTRVGPNVGDLSLYGRMLGEDVGAATPTVGALEMACTTVRRDCRFVPSIAEVLQEIEAAEKVLREWSYMASAVPGRIEDLRTMIAEARATAATERASEH